MKGYIILSNGTSLVNNSCLGLRQARLKIGTPVVFSSPYLLCSATCLSVFVWVGNYNFEYACCILKDYTSNLENDISNHEWAVEEVTFP